LIIINQFNLDSFNSQYSIQDASYLSYQDGRLPRSGDPLTMGGVSPGASTPPTDGEQMSREHPLHRRVNQKRFVPCS